MLLDATIAKPAFNDRKQAMRNMALSIGRRCNTVSQAVKELVSRDLLLTFK